MIYQNAYDHVMCDGDGKFHNEVFLIVMGDYLNQIWSYVFCKPCVMRIHYNYEWMSTNPSRSINVAVRGQNLQVYDLLIWGEPINAANASMYDLPDYAIQR